jgi:WD40 repeat protein
MSSRAAAVSQWLVPLIVVVASLWWIDKRAGWDAVFAPAAAPKGDGREQHAMSVFALDSTADGDTMLCCLRGDLSHGARLLIFAADGQKRRLPAAEALIGQTVFWSAALFPDGTRLVVAGGPAGLARVDLLSGEVAPLPAAFVPPECTRLAISPDGSILAVALPSETVLLDATKWTERARLPNPDDAVAEVVFSPDGRLLAVGRTDGKIELWDVATGALLRGWHGHPPVTRRLRFVGDGSRLASVGFDGAIRLWETETGRELWSDPGDGNWLEALAVSADGVTAAVGGFGADIHIWNLDMGRRERTLTGHTRSITALQFIRGGTLLVSTSDDGTMRFWDAAEDFACVGCNDLGRGP